MRLVAFEGILAQDRGGLGAACNLAHHVVLHASLRRLGTPGCHGGYVAQSALHCVVSASPAPRKEEETSAIISLGPHIPK